MLRSRLVLFLFLFMSLAILSANPFLGNEQQDLPEAPRRGGTPLEQLAQWQISLKDKMGSLFQQASQGDAAGTLFPILALSFLYGVIHAAGPGHRKTIIFSLFIGRKSRWWEPFSAGFFSAGLHGMSGLALILILFAISRSMLSSRMNRLSLYFEGITYLLLMILALIMAIFAFREFRRGHSHHHGIQEESQDEKSRSRGLYSTLAVSSLFPCPGAVMILMFALAVGTLGLGIWALISLSLGMGVTVSATAYLGMSGRQGLFLALKKRERLVERLSSLMEIGAYLFLFLYAFWAVTPFLLTLGS